MTNDSPYSGRRPESGIQLNPRSLWAGALATGVVTALIAILGILVCRGIFDLTILAPKDRGTWGDASTAVYAIVAFLAALLAAGLIQLLFRFTPQPAAFFNWIVALITLIAAVVPFVFDAGLADQVATAILNALLGLTILILISATARRSLPAAVRRGSNPNPRPPRPF